MTDFAAELKSLRAQAGNPSLDELVRLTRRTGWPQQKTTISDKLNAVSAPSETFVRAFAEACRLHAEASRLPSGPAAGDTERLAGRCREMSAELAKVRRENRPGIAQERQPDRSRRTAASWDPVQLGVHPVIQVPGRPSWQHELPGYLERPLDGELRRLLRESMGRPRMVVLAGGSSTGKTRAAYQAVRCTLPGWPLLVPGTAAELAESLADGLADTQCVIWLDEAQNYLRDGDAARALRKLLQDGAGDVAVLATLWHGHWESLCAPAADGTDAPYFAAGQLLELAARVEVPDRFGAAEVEKASHQGHGDPLIAAAVRQGGARGQITQALAAGLGLQHFYHDADPISRAVITAAMDARRLGCAGLVPAVYLREAAAGYLDGEQRAAAAIDWFGQALRGCSSKVLGAVAPLTPVRTLPGIGEADGYRLAEFLDQWGRELLRENPPPAAVWEALAAHVTAPGDRGRTARAAARRGLFQHAYVLAVPAAQAGDVAALGILAGQHERTGQRTEAAGCWERAAALRDSHAMCELARFHEEHGRAEDARVWWQRAAGLGNPYAIWQWVDRLDRSGDTAGAEGVLRNAAEAGEPYAMQELTRRLTSRGSFAEAEALWRAVVERGHWPSVQSVTGMLELGSVLSRAGRAAEAESTLRRAAEQGNAAAMNELAGLLERAGHTGEADEWRRRAAGRGHAPAMQELAARYLRDGNAGEAESWLLRLADTGHTSAMWHLADLRTRDDDQVAAGHWLARAIAHGDSHALRELTSRLEQTGRDREAESLLRSAAENGHPAGLADLARFAERHGRPAEAALLRQYGIDPGGQTAEPWGAAAQR